MATSQRVQMYLEKHKIGALFEELMGKVIADQPDDPTLYLIKTLERRATRQNLAVRRSEGDGLSVPKERGYEKPWQTHTKKARPTRDSSGDRTKKSTGAKPEWDHRTNPSGTFEDLWDSKDGRKARGQRSASPSRKSVTQSWVDHTEDDEFLFASHGYSGPRHRGTDIDPLAGEFDISQATSIPGETVNKLSVPRSKGQQRDAMKHKQELQKLILSKKMAEDSGIEDDKDQTRDDAVELMENEDDLRNEGVVNVKGSKGVAVRQSSRQTQNKDTGVRVSICARCAKVMTGEPSDSAPGVGKYGQLDDYDYEVDKDFPTSRPQSAVRFSPNVGAESDEEFESVSQVTGPRRPVWQDDSDSESVTPRKGKHMFSSSTVPTKGRPMYSPEHTSKPSNLKQAAVAQFARSADFQQSAIRGQQAAVNQTWSPAIDSSDEEGVMPHVPSTVASGRGAGWKVHNYDTDDAASSYYGSPSTKGRKDMSGPY